MYIEAQIYILSGTYIYPRPYVRVGKSLYVYKTIILLVYNKKGEDFSPPPVLYSISAPCFPTYEPYIECCDCNLCNCTHYFVSRSRCACCFDVRFYHQKRHRKKNTHDQNYSYNHVYILLSVDLPGYVVLLLCIRLWLFGSTPFAAHTEYPSYEILAFVRGSVPGKFCVYEYDHDDADDCRHM